MKKYEIVMLNKEFTLSREKDIARSQELINTKASEGWTLLQVMSPNDWGGALYGIFVKDED